MRKSNPYLGLQVLIFPFSRALHSAALATIGACGFLASAVIPPTAYKVRCEQSIWPHILNSG